MKITKKYSFLVEIFSKFEKKKYFVFYEIVKDPDSDIAYTIDHSLTTFLIARNGRVKKLIDKQWTSTQLAEAIRAALRD